ncbi:hypothetical protein AAF712_003199 [Marasmius tenuissimus]|uniref:Uncharacterized protein n=1 Tax=Marasmius tenuissimus TaxID=585030 RepID=A0ABR3A886_9AGAR
MSIFLMFLSAYCDPSLISNQTNSVSKTARLCSPDTNEQSGQYYLKKAVSLESRVQAILGGSRAEYCNGLYLEYLKDQEDGTEGDVLLSQHDRFQGISRKFHVYMSGVLNTVGAGDMYNRIHEMEVEVSLTAAAIGDMFCQAALGLDSFREHFNRKLFRFQRP